MSVHVSGKPKNSTVISASEPEILSTENDDIFIATCSPDARMGF
jgi:hypothetical protein